MKKGSEALNDQSVFLRIITFIKRHARPALIGGVIILIGIGAAIYWLMGSGKESTDDAQINGHIVMVTARVAGHIHRVYVDNTDRVEAGQLLVQIDRRDLLQALRKSQGDLATQIATASAASNEVEITMQTAPSSLMQATAATQIALLGEATAQTQLASAQAQIVAAEAAVKAAHDDIQSAQTDYEAAVAQVEAAQAQVAIAQADVVAAKSNAQTQSREADRYKYMLQQGAVSRQQYENMVNINTSAQSSLRSSQSQLQASRVAVEQAISHREGAQAMLARANSKLVSSMAGLTQARAGAQAAEVGSEQARSKTSQAQAAQAGTQTVEPQIRASENQLKAAAAKIAQSRASVDTAELNLSYTSVYAAKKGEIVSRNVNQGQYVQPGQALMAIVPLHDVWVTANFKETQIEHMKPGQRADIKVDTYSGKTFRGKVKGIEAASGERLSLLPPQNATGNFVKVVQRIPVRIVFDQTIPEKIVFRPGQNVVVTVYTR